jgi:hypothetical protein
MNAARLIYRSRQFVQTIISSATSEDLDLAASLLTPGQLALFRDMQSSEQAHALRLLSVLISQGETNPDLFIAALLHDVGKTRLPLRVWDRVLIVLSSKICPSCVRRWGSYAPEVPLDRLGLRRPFVAAMQHPAWGAELAASRNVSTLAVALIRRHQEKVLSEGTKRASVEDTLLLKLQAADEVS